MVTRLRAGRRARLLTAAGVLAAGGVVTFALGLALREQQEALPTEALWTVDVGGRDPVVGAGGPAAELVVVDGVLVRVADGSAFGIDPRTGLVRWSTDIPDEEGTGTVVVAGNRVIVESSRLHSLDPTTGAISWSADLSTRDAWQAATPELVVVAELIESAADEEEPDLLVRALEAASGIESWSHTGGGGESITGVAVAPETVVVGLHRQGASPGDELDPDEPTDVLFALDAATGEERWRIEVVPHRNLVSVDGIAAVTTMSGVIVGIDTASGEELWRRALGEFLHPGIVEVAGGGIHVLAFDSEGGQAGLGIRLVSLEPGTGRERWRTDVIRAVQGSLRASGDRLLVIEGGVGRDVPATVHAFASVSGDPLWEHSLGESAARAAGGTPDDGVYLSQVSGAVRALEAADGALRWVVDPGPRQGSDDDRPLVVDGSVYHVGGDGSLRALDGATGEERWRARHSITGYSQPASDGEVAVAVTGLGIVRAYEIGSGDVIWETERRHDILAPTAPRPVVAAETAVVPGVDGAVRGLDVTDGAERWSITLDALPVGADAIGDITVVVSVEGSVSAVTTTTGEALWTADLGVPVRSRPVVTSGMALVSTGDGRLVALDVETGGELWTFATSTPFPPPPAADDDTVYLAVGSTLSALDPASGDLRWTFETDAPLVGWPVVDGNRVHVTTGDARLHTIVEGREQEPAIDLGAPPLTSLAAESGLIVVVTTEGSLQAYG